jgi:hypothetical protein
MANLILGLWSGMIRIGWSLPKPGAAVYHGALMIGGFFTTLIALEKVIPLKRKLAFIIPLVSALTLVITIDGYVQIGMIFLMAGSVGLMLVQCWYLIKFPEDRSVLLMVIGAACLVVANILLFKRQLYPVSFPWWMSFILLTIVGERLELSRFLPVPGKARTLLYVVLAIFWVGLILPFHGIGKYLSGASLILVAAWLLRFDVIRVGLRSEGLTRYSAVALLMGNISLIMEGIFMIALSDTMLAYDMLVHTFFVGFGFTMVFAHGPIILPAVLGISQRPYSRILYVWLFILQGSLYLRIFSDSAVELELRKYSGLLTSASIVLYFITILTLVIRGRRHEVIS